MKRTLSLLMAVLMLTAGVVRQAAVMLPLHRAKQKASLPQRKKTTCSRRSRKRAPSRSRWKALGRRGHTTMPMITLSAMT